AGELEVEEHEPRPERRAARAAEERLHRLHPVARDMDARAVPFEGVEGELEVVAVVLDEQDRGVGHRLHHSQRVSRVKENVAPVPGRASAHTRPPWRSTMRRTSARPTPVPSYSSSRCRRWKTPNSRSA